MLGDTNNDRCTSVTTVVQYVECGAEFICEIIKNMHTKNDFHTFKTIRLRGEVQMLHCHFGKTSVKY